ncbi:unnamed protein product [Leuciscus chuanchicus]
MEYQDADHKTQQCQRQLTDQPEKQEIKGECKNEDELNKVCVLGENGLCSGNVKLRAGSADHKSVGYHRLESVTLVRASQRLRPPSMGIRRNTPVVRHPSLALQTRTSLTVSSSPQRPDGCEGKKRKKEGVESQRVSLVKKIRDINVVVHVNFTAMPRPYSLR